MVTEKVSIFTKYKQIMGKGTTKPPNAPSTTGRPSGGGRGNNPSNPKPRGNGK